MNEQKLARDLARARASLDVLCPNGNHDAVIERAIAISNDVVMAAWDEPGGRIGYMFIEGEEKIDELLDLARLDLELDDPFAEFDDNFEVEVTNLTVPVKNREHALRLRKKYGGET
jgi:hypothetical protein